MKNLFNNNEENDNNNEKKVCKTNKLQNKFSSPKQKEVYPDIITPKEREEIENVQKMESTSSLNISQNIIQHQNEQLPNNIHQHNSFLESCIQEDFFQSFANLTPHNMNSSFDFSSLLNINNGGNNEDSERNTTHPI